jgi:hypothetical protein
MNIDQMNSQIEEQTKLNSLKRKQLINWLAQQNVLVQNDVVKEQRNQFFKLQKIETETDTRQLSSLFLAINIPFQKLEYAKKKNKSSTLSELEKVSELAIKAAQKEKRKEIREKLINYLSIVNRLKSEDYSYRSISKFLKDRHKFVISHTYIRKVYLELEVK